MSEKVLKVTLVEEEGKTSDSSFDQLEQLAFRLMEVDKLIEESKVKLSDAEMDLADFKQRSELEKRFSELTGALYEDKTLELEANVKSLKGQLESLSSERVKLRNEILSGLVNVIAPIEANGCPLDSEEEILFKFRDGAKYPAITAFLKKELKFGVPPVYFTLVPEGLKVVGATDKTSAIKEAIKAIESLRAKAAGETGRREFAGLNERLQKPANEEHPSKGILTPFKKLHAPSKKPMDENPTNADL